VLFDGGGVFFDVFFLILLPEHVLTEYRFPLCLFPRFAPSFLLLLLSDRVLKPCAQLYMLVVLYQIATQIHRIFDLFLVSCRIVKSFH
jgi:hypothetical protein